MGKGNSISFQFLHEKFSIFGRVILENKKLIYKTVLRVKTFDHCAINKIIITDGDGMIEEYFQVISLPDRKVIKNCESFHDAEIEVIEYESQVNHQENHTNGPRI